MSNGILCRGKDSFSRPLAVALWMMAATASTAEPISGLHPLAAVEFENAAARWQAGFVRHEGEWLRPAEVAELAGADERLHSYARLRDAAADTAADQAALARWCDRSLLPDEARVHWLTVLARRPGDPEATSALGLRPFQGQWLTPARIALAKHRIRQVEQAAEAWRPLVARWRKAAEQVAESMPADVAERIAAIAQEPEMLGLWRELSRQGRGKDRSPAGAVMGRQFVAALRLNPHPLAAAALVQLAVFGEPAVTRRVAAGGLAGRPLDHFVPLLLAGLQMPLEPRIDSTTGYRGLPVVRYCVVQERMLDVRKVTRLVQPAEAYASLGSDEAVDPSTAQRLRERANPDIAVFRATVTRANAVIAERNSRIDEALTLATGREVDQSPSGWWTWWWQDHNEMYGMDRSPKPVVESEAYDWYPARVGPTLYPPPPECFARGTPVWTLTGREPIEAIKAGDRVLAQDPVSGELAFKPVLATTTRPPGPRVQVGLATESIVATPGHPFWVHGRGWVMAKHLTVGDRLHAYGGSVTIDSVKVVPAPIEHYEQAYNLIVADFPTYFVGSRGMLVHDNTPRAPTTNPQPGLVSR